MRAIAFSLLMAGLLVVPGLGQSARDFNGSNQTVECGDIDALEGIDNLTCGCWARLDDDDAAIAGMIGKRDGAGTTVWYLAKTASEQAFWVVNNSGVKTATGATTFAVGEWNHFVGTFDRSLASSRLKVYLNGELDGAGDGNGTVGISANANVVAIGRQFGSRWDGQIAHCFCEPRTWSAAEVMEAYRGDLALIQRAAQTGGYWPGWDPEATPTTYRGQGLFAGVCSATNHPAVSSDGPPVFIPGGGQ